MKKDKFAEKLVEALQILLVIVLVIVIGGAMFYYSYLEWDTKIKTHEIYSNAAENLGNK